MTHIKEIIQKLERTAERQRKTLEQTEGQIKALEESLANEAKTAKLK